LEGMIGAFEHTWSVSEGFRGLGYTFGYVSGILGMIESRHEEGMAEI
jgi:hypothetical protein